MVKHCVAPACSNCPGPTSRSTISPATGASSGNLQVAASFAIASGSAMPSARNASAVDSTSACAWRAIGFGLLHIALGDGLVRVEIDRALVILVGELRGVLAL